jgi:uncharacterized repeat protein (TIGR01451 family)
MKNRRRNLAVSELIGTILMLGMAVSSFAMIYHYFQTAPTPNPAPIVEISGSINENYIEFMHHGGEPLSLDTEFLVSLGGKIKSIKVGDFLDNKSKLNGVWNIGEKVIYPITFDYDYINYPYGNIYVVDKKSNSLLLTGRVGIEPVSDLSVMISVDNQFPGMETNIVFTIMVTNNGNINTSNIQIKFLLAEGLTHYLNSTTQGIYNNSSGIWDIGTIVSGKSEYLFIETTIGERGALETTQLVLLLDGSGSIAPEDWSLQKDGLAAALSNEDTFPHDGSVELTIIQFGGGFWIFPGYAKLEIGPVVIDKSNYALIANNIKNIKQLKQMTPTACGIYMGADTLFNSDIFDPIIRQIVMIVTDGDPTQGCNCDGDYKADLKIDETFKESAEIARNYLINKLKMTIDQDEFDAIAIGESAPHASWLKEKIVWPEIGYYAPPFLITKPHWGWLRNVSTWEEFAESIDECFGIIFNQIKTEVEIHQSSFTDPKVANDFDEILIIPMSSPIVITQDASNIDETNATFNMYYNFKWVDYGEVRFAYKIKDDNILENWEYTPWINKSGSGYYSRGITGLFENTEYIYKAQLKYDRDLTGTTIINVKSITFFTLN